LRIEPKNHLNAIVHKGKWAGKEPEGDVLQE
jgi:hypothetical protein